MPHNTTNPSLNQLRSKCENVFNYPHIVAMYIHLRFNIFREEVLQKHLGVKEYWYRLVISLQQMFSFLYVFIFFLHLFFSFSTFFRSEWKHRGSTHIHGFLWLYGAPNMEPLDWSNPSSVNAAKTYFDKYITTWNPRDIHGRKILVSHNLNDDPCLLESAQIFSSNPCEDYENFLNRVERHTKFNVDSCL